jgi:hypothetical protein
MSASVIRIKRSAVPGKKPVLTDLLPGELALNTYDAELYVKRIRAGIGSDIVKLGIGATVTNILYVTKDGKDTNTGKKLGDAKGTIKGAVAASTTGTVIKVSAGVYIEDNPIVLPNQVSVVGDSLREVSVIPKNQADLFHVGNGCYVAEMSYFPLNGQANPNAVFAFDPVNKRYIDQSPYIQNCTNFIPESIGLEVDGNKALGPIKSMVLDSYTQYNPAGTGASMTNEGYAQLVSLFTICDDIAVFCGSGGACDLTNSNSSFGNFGLIAEGVGPLKYKGYLTQDFENGNDTFTLDLSTPTLKIANASWDNISGVLTAYTETPHDFSVGMNVQIDNLAFKCSEFPDRVNVTNALYDNTSGITTIYTEVPHKFQVGFGVSIVGLGFTCPSGPGIVTYPSGNLGYNFEVLTVAPGRYVDASNLILANKTEIQDKSLAAIALNHPDFYFPNDPQTNSYSRFYDSYRLIQQNKREIIDKSLASIAIGFPSDFYFPDENETTPQSRYYDASGLIQRNKQEIIDKSLASVAVNHPDFYFPGDTQTNSRSRYYDSYRLIQQNKDEIINTAWNATASAYPAIVSTEVTCKRDIGFFIDAISTDIFTGGNNYSRQFTLQYFDGSGNLITNGLLGEQIQSVYAFEQARELMKQAITNQLTIKDLTLTESTSVYGGGGTIISNTNPASCSDVQQNINNLVGIVTFVVGAGSTLTLPSENLGNFTTGGTKCARDIGYLIDALSTDVFTGGNKYSRDFTLQYFNNGSPISNGLLGEEAQSITAFEAVRDYAKKAITNQLNVKNLGISGGLPIYDNFGSGGFEDVLPSGNPNACADVQSTINTLISIVTTVISQGTPNYLNTFSENLGISTTNICARDLGYFVDAISTDVFTGGNSYSIDFAKQYFNGPTPVGIATAEREESVYAFHSAREFAKKAITNQLNVKDLTITADPTPTVGIVSNTNPTSCANVRTTIDTLVGIITQAIGTGTTTTLYNLTPNPGIFITGISTCRRDIGFVIDAIATDVRDYTNKNIINATRSYFDSFGTPIENGLVGEEAETVTAFKAIGDYAKLAINNQLNVKDLTLIADPETGSNIDPLSCANVRTFIDNLVGIITTSVSRGDLDLVPAVSFASTVFTVNVGTSTLPHTYVSGGTAFYLEEYFLNNGTVVDADYDNVTGITTITLAVDHNFRVGYAAEITGLGFTCPSGPGIVTYPSGSRGYIFKVDNVINDKTFVVNVGVSTLPHTYVSGGVVNSVGRAYPSGNFGYKFKIISVGPGRYLDAYDSIIANKQEIQDKSLAAIAVGAGSTFFFPGEEETNPRSRYYDAYRLIQQNKEEILDKSLASIAVGASSSFYFPGESETNPRSRYYDASGLIQRNKQEIVDKSLVSIAAGFPTGFYFPDEDETNPRSRYYDASGLIQRNKQEISDKALASLSVGFPSSFYFPDESQVNSRSRFYDASGLIQINKQEIIDKSLAAVAIAHSDFYFPGDTQTNSRSRYYDAYRLIQQNKQEIINIALTNTYNLYPEIISTELKCIRDLGFFIDAISTDVFTGGNNYAREFTLQYFNAAGNLISNGLLGEQIESNYAFGQARDLMKQAITNQLTIKDLTVTGDPFPGEDPPPIYGDPGNTSGNTSPFSCTDVQNNIDTLVGIVTTVIGAGSTSSLPSPNYGNFTTGGTKCARDLGFLVDALSTDVFTGGNKYSRDFTLQYFDNVGAAITTGLVGEEAESITAFNAARNYAKKAVTNQLNKKRLYLSPGTPIYGNPGTVVPNLPSGNPNACADVQSNIDNLVSIITTVIGAGNTSYLSTFAENVGVSTTNKCARDLRFLVEAIGTDVFTGGNKYSYEFVLQYFNNGTPISNGLVGEISQSVYTFDKVREYAKKAVTNQLNVKNIGISSGPATYGGGGGDIPVLPSGNPNSCTDVQNNIDTLVGIVTTYIGAGSTVGFPVSYNLGVSTTNTCARDLGFLVDALATDVFTGGNKYSYEFVLQYFDGATSVGIQTAEREESVYAFQTVREYAKKAITNQLNIKNLGISSGPATYGGPGGNIPILPSGNLDSCTDVQGNINTLVGIVTTYIGAGSTVGFPGSYNLGVTTSLKCRRDLGYLLDAVSTDVFTGGNKYSRDFTKFYFDNVGSATTALLGEEAESVYAFKSLGEYAKKAVTNQLNRKDVGISSGPATYNGAGGSIAVLPSGSPTACADVRSNIDNLVGIVTTVIESESLAFLNTFSENLGTLTDGAKKCYRDIGYIIDAVALDIRDYTNKNIIQAVKSYFNSDGTPLLTGIASEEDESIVAFHAVRDYAKLAINNQLNNRNLDLIPDALTGSNQDPGSCTDVKDSIDSLVGILTTRIKNGNLNTLGLPAVSVASTVFSMNVGTSTLPHTYFGGGIAKIDVIRPFDGEVVFFKDLYYTVKKINVLDGGSGYVTPPIITIDSPSTSWGIPAGVVPEIRNGQLVALELVSSGRGYSSIPRVNIEPTNVGVTTAKVEVILQPDYYYVTSSTAIDGFTGITTVTVTSNTPYTIGIGTEVYFYKQSRVLASGHSLEYIGSGTDIDAAIPFNGGVPIQDNETDSRDGGLVVFTSTDQSGNFRIGDGVIVNQATGTISGTFYSKSLFSTITPFILALGGE